MRQPKNAACRNQQALAETICAYRNTKPLPRKSSLLGVLAVPVALSSVSVAAAAADESPVLQEIVVTATRREETISKVPLSMVATDQVTLDKQGIRAVEDLMRLTPSVTFGQSALYFGTGQSVIAIRGIVSTSGIPATGVYIDDTPIQSRTGISPSLSNAYPKLFDLDRVEVLRGPQGTLFGTGSVGGAVRFITPEPSLRNASAYTRTEIGSTENGGVSWEQGIAGGMPLIEDKLGFRASVWHREDAGYVDRLDRATFQRTEEDINKEISDSARLVLGWKPLENLTVTPSVFVQRTDVKDSPRYELATSDVSEGKLNTSLTVRDEPHWDRFSLPALNVSLDLNDVTLISNTSYFDRRTRTRSDDTMLSLAVFGGYTGEEPYPEELYDYAPGTSSLTTQTALTQEVRLQSNSANSRFNWVLGAFFQRAVTRDRSDGADPDLLDVLNYGAVRAGLPPASSVAEVFGTDLYQGVYSNVRRLSYRDLEKSVFAQVDYEVVPRLTLTLGLRYSVSDFTYKSFIAGPLFGTAEEGNFVTLKSSSKPLTPKFGVAFQANDDNLFYANAAKGVRGSGVAEAEGARCQEDGDAIGFNPLVSREVKPDKIWSYEVGSKSRLLEGRLAVDLSAYRVDWDNVQTTIVLPICQNFSTLNLGKAKSEGLDVVVSTQPFAGLSLGAAASYIDARYTTNLPGPNDAIIRRKGEPFDVAPWSWNLNAEYVFDALGAQLYTRADYSHTTHNDKALDLGSPLVDPGLPRAPATSQLDLRAGTRIQDWDISLFLANALNDHPVLSRTHPSVGSLNYTSTTFRPRTVGVTVTFRR